MHKIELYTGPSLSNQYCDQQWTIEMTMDRMCNTMGSLTHQHTHPFNSSTGSQSMFDGFSHRDISHVPNEIWEIVPRQGSYSIQVYMYDELAFKLLEELVCQKYGTPQNMSNGRIYRGQAADTHDYAVVITFYGSTLLVRVQGAGYALWVNKTLPVIADKVMIRITELRSRHLNKPTPLTAPTTPCSPNPSCTQHDTSIPKFDLSSTPIIGSLSNSPIPSGLQNNHIRNIIMFAEQKGQIETENCMLKKTITELEGKDLKAT